MKVDPRQSYENVLQNTSKTPGWDKFFSNFPKISDQEKRACIEHFLESVSHEMKRMMDRMLKAYKDMRNI